MSTTSKAKREAAQKSATIAKIDADIAKAQSALARAREEFDEAALALAENPTNAQAQQECDQLEDIMREHTKNLEMYQRAKAAAERRDTREAKQQALADVKRLVASVDAQMTRERELAEQVVATLQSISPILAELEKIGQDAHAEAYAALRLALDDPREIERRFAEIAHSVRGYDAIPSVVAALWETGLGRTGLPMHREVQVYPIGVARPVDVAMRDAQERVRGKLAKVVKDREQELK